MTHTAASLLSCMEKGSALLGKLSKFQNMYNLRQIMAHPPNIMLNQTPGLKEHILYDPVPTDF